MNFRIDWIDGAPEKLEPGMVVRVNDEVILVGHLSDFSRSNVSLGAVTQHGWLIKRHELDWLDDMAQRHGKGRPQE